MTRRTHPHIVHVGLPALLVAACTSAGGATSGVVEAPRLVLSAEQAGRVLAVTVPEGGRAELGDVLVQLDCTVPQAQLEAARAQARQAAAAIAQAEAALALLDEGPRAQDLDAARAERDAARETLRMARSGATDGQRAQLQATLDALDARLTLASANHNRYAVLAAQDAAAQAQLDAARAELDATAAERARARAALDDAVAGARVEEVRIGQLRLEQAEARLSALEAGARVPERNAAGAQVEAARAAADAAAAGVVSAEAAVARCEVRAPVAGVVDIVALEVGELAAPGAPLLALAADAPPEVRTWATAAELADVHVGYAVPIRIEVPGAPELLGRVVRIDDQAEFTASNVQTPDDRATLVWEVTLRLDAAPGSVRPGATATVDFGAARVGTAEGSR